MEPELRRHLEKALKETDNKTVILRGDRKVVLEQAVYVLDQAQLAGAEGFALATKKPKPARGLSPTRSGRGTRRGRRRSGGAPGAGARRPGTS